MQTLHRMGYIASLALIFLAVIGLTQGVFDAWGFVSLVAVGVASGCLFVYLEWAGE